MTVSTVVFDVGNVLLRWDVFALYRTLLPDDAAIRAFLEEVDFFAWNLELDRGADFDVAVPALSAQFPHRAALIAAYRARWNDSVTGEIAGSVAILRALRRAGVPVYAITNFSGEKWREAQARFDFLREAFIDVVVSADEGLIKPDARIYERLLTRNGLKAADCVFIDDSPHNVAGAKAVGMDAVLFTDPATLERDLRARGLSF